MKTVITILLVLLIISSCDELFKPNLSETQKQFLLYDIDSRFYFLKNKKDTIELQVESIKDIDSSSGEEKILTFKRVCLTNTNTWGTIRVEYDNDYSLYFTSSNFTDNLNNLTPSNSDTIINQKQYSNVYFMTSQYNDTVFFSLEKGIIQIKNPRSETIYDLIE